MTHEEADHVPHGPDRPLLPRPAADGVPHPDQGAGRAAAARGGPAHARVHHEGRLLVRPRRGRAWTPPTTSRPGPTTGSSTAPGSSGTAWSPTWGRWAASAPTSTWRRAPRGRTTWRCRTPATRRTWRSPPPRRSRSRACPAPLDAPERVETPGAKTIEQVCAALDVPAGRADQGAAGDRRRRRAAAGGGPRRPPPERDQAGQRAGQAGPRRPPRRRWATRFGAPPGFIGPVGAQAPVLADEALRGLAGMVAGANEPDAHLRGVEVGRDFECDFADVRTVEAGDTCPDGRRDPDRARDRGRQHLQARHALLRAAGRHLPGRGRQGAADLDGLATASARPGSWPPRWSSSPTTAASRGRARWRRSTSTWSPWARRARTPVAWPMRSTRSSRAKEWT